LLVIAGFAVGSVLGIGAFDYTSAREPRLDADVSALSIYTD
jgi:hypothetical protein